MGEPELRYGVSVLPSGRRQAALASAIEAILRTQFNGQHYTHRAHSQYII